VSQRQQRAAKRRRKGLLGTAPPTVIPPPVQSVIIPTRPVQSVIDDPAATRRIIAARASLMDVLQRFASMWVEGHIRFFLAVGPPGRGKTAALETVVDRFAVADKLFAAQGSPHPWNTILDAHGKPECEPQGSPVFHPRHLILSTRISPIELYEWLFHYRQHKQCVAVDDVTRLLVEHQGIATLKDAGDTRRQRRLRWGTKTTLLSAPRHFDYDGSLWMIVNLTLLALMRHPRLGMDYRALLSRAYVLDFFRPAPWTPLPEREEEFVVLRDRLENGMLNNREAVLHDADGQQAVFGPALTRRVLDFMASHLDRAYDVSLRWPLKIARLMLHCPADWEALAAATCLVNV
jgi:hypothetical protein